LLIGIGILFIDGITARPRKAAPDSEAMQTSHTLYIAMSDYATDHDGHFPDGASSTQVAQELLDGGYITGPHIYYLEMLGKTKPRFDTKRLTTENISWDFTAPCSTKSPDAIPLIFCTGYRVEYKPDGKAIALGSGSGPTVAQEGIAVSYVSGASRYTREDASGTIPHFIARDTHFGDTIYRQLTPDGTLAPAP
jgi:hypothetical protein